MKTIIEIEKAIEQLDPAELAALRAWFARYDSEIRDSKIESDIDSGRLEQLEAEALADLREGRCTDL